MTKSEQTTNPSDTSDLECDHGEILTDVRHGYAAIEPFLPELREDGEFIIMGEASESFCNQWDCAFYLLRSSKRNLYALKLVNFGDSDSHSEGENPCHMVVAVWPDPPTQDESAIVRALLAKYKEDGGQYVEFETSVGKFKLDE